MCLWDAQRNSLASPHSDRTRSEDSEWIWPKARSRLSWSQEDVGLSRILHNPSVLAMPCWPRVTGFPRAVSLCLWRIAPTYRMWMWTLWAAAPSLLPRPRLVVPGLGWPEWTVACQSPTVFGSNCWPKHTGGKWNWVSPPQTAVCLGLGYGKHPRRTASDLG